MATRRQKYHSMIVASEKIVKSVNRDMDRFGLNNKHKDWKSVFKLDPHPMKSGGAKIMATKRSQNHKYLVTVQKRYHHMGWHFGVGDKARWRAINKAKDYEISYNWKKWEEQHPDLVLANALQKLGDESNGN